MTKIHFVFTKHQNSFSVHVKNLELLLVEQIKEIETFVELRRGFFDFNTYTFSIKKRVEFIEFKALVETIFTDSFCEEVVLKIPQKNRVEYGKYKGMIYCDLPDVYLLWLKSNYHGKDREIIEAELKSRDL
ncbi:hypothetical protein Suden_1039 [Sulfurimonas denitrificans DSM 1251]|uniref:Uncharacterized protein n=1 Tax=Sulfurimonas denitrificans (strain ATCC 33889 / DSM 1251) TaxID=326298 RepID=Q30RR4_SULDN|nr:DUF3820 family protein [Sulfurimonas denitrificans]ABB44317.1 hypothetical protein Suden_1039 [Sulfurimonas denitrificans DSM 1251]MDD3441989.1 DUF3820 family protein [Sulfurimonas denitrificans]